MKVTQTLLGRVRVVSINMDSCSESDHELSGEPHARCLTGIYDRAEGSLARTAIRNIQETAAYSYFIQDITTTATKLGVPYFSAPQDSNIPIKSRSCSSRYCRKRQGEE